MLFNTTLRFNQRRRLPMIFQDEQANCGHACVAMISQYWGHDLDFHTLKSIQHTTNRGTTLLELIHLLEPLSLMPRALRVSLDELKHVQCPAILHWEMNHFVVLKSVKKNHVLIHDPAAGIRRCTLKEVSDSFTGIVLEVTKAPTFQSIKQNHSLRLSHLLQRMTGVSAYLVLLLILTLLIEGLSLVHPLFIQYITDEAMVFNELGNLYTIAIGFFIVIMMHTFMEYLRGSMAIYLTHQLTEQFSSNVVRHLLALPLAFFEKRQRGDIQTRFQSIEYIQKKLSTDFVNTILDGLMLIINFLVMWIYQPLLTLIVLSMLGVNLASRHFSYFSLKRHTDLSVNQQAKANSVFLETLTSMLPIKAFLKEQTQLMTWRYHHIKAQNATIRVSKLTLFYQVMEQGLFQTEYVLVVAVGATLVLSRKLSIGMLMAFLAYRLLFLSKASLLIKQWFDYKLLSIHLNRLSDILFQKRENIYTGIGLTEHLQGRLCLKNICFKYDEKGPFVLNNLSLDINAHEKVALVGSSGCGKSTCLKVMMGLLEKTSGEIFIDDIPLASFGLKNYRLLTASVMQEDTLLTGSILNNISFFDENVDTGRVYYVCELMCMHETICQLPMGYETRIGEVGSPFSGGQKQRLLLARALYKKPKILFLDEATSHLDLAHEQRINQALTSLNITQVIVAHREETIRMADRIIQLDINRSKT